MWKDENEYSDTFNRDGKIILNGVIASQLRRSVVY